MRRDGGYELVVTTGDPQGIGPEVSLRGAREFLEVVPEARVVLVGEGRSLGGEILEWERGGAGLRALRLPDSGSEFHLPPSAAGGAAALRALEEGVERVLASGGAKRPARSALVTAPLSKEAVSAAGAVFHGHTGWLGERFGVEEPLMVFVAEGLRVALATVHIPLSAVPGRLASQGLERPLRQLAQGLRLFGIEAPRIAVLGLNPHAGEGGLLGCEEGTVIKPAIDAFNLNGAGAAFGPFSADTFFRPDSLKAFDGVLAMYHDQGLVAVKCLAFGKSVNLSLGLPIIRTSVDHGCAFDIAGREEADPSSMVAALTLAWKLLLSSQSSQTPH